MNNLLKSADLHGKQLSGRDGAKLGVVREAFVDLATGAIAFLIVESQGLLGGSGKFHPVPWSVVRFDGVAGGFVVDMAKEEFKSAPSYDRDQLANANYGWDDQAERFFTSGRGA